MTRPRVTDRARRNRLLRRHRLAADTRATSVVETAESMVGLHSTTPSTVYLAAWARIDGFTSASMDDALYVDRSLVKQLAMRRTLFVFPRDLLREAVGAVGPRVTASERTNMLRDLRRSEWCTDPDGWIDAARTAVAAELVDGVTLTSSQIRERLPEFNRTVIVSPGKSYGGTNPMLPRIINMMSAAGDIVRGPNSAGWHMSRPSWSSMRDWLGEQLDPPDPATAYAAMVRRWLASFGPGTESDLVWWLGSTKAAVRQALAQLDIAEVELDDGSVGYVLAEDVVSPDDDDLEPQAVLLPELDSTTMGHKIRDFYLGPHGEHIFDRNGNGGQTVWWDGRIVGGWYRDDDTSIRVHLFEKLPAGARRAVDDRADELATWLGGAQIRPGYPAPFVRGLREQR
ncbi:winged helix DNA-binding domain-containing protein [Gordonia sp. NPDC003504]